MRTPSTDLSDERLIEIAAGNDPRSEGAWRLLDGRIRDGLQSWLQAERGLTEDQARDICQDTLVRAFRHAHRFNPERSAFTSWVWTIADRLAQNRQRDDRRGASPVAVLAGDESESSWWARTPDSRGRSPIESFEHRHAAEALEDAVDDLGPQLRPVVLGRIEGRKHAELADDLGIPVGTVKSRLARARRSLRSALKERGVEVEEVVAT